MKESFHLPVLKFKKTSSKLASETYKCFLDNFSALRKHRGFFLAELSIVI